MPGWHEGQSQREPRRESCASVVFRKLLILAGTVALLASARARAQSEPSFALTSDAGTAAVSPNRPALPPEKPAQDLIFEGISSFGNYRIFAGGSNAHLYTGGVEYDRYSWGRHLGARTDYSAEFLPLMVLNAPAVTDIWGDTIGPGRKILYGIGFSPIGVRFVWGQRAIRPYYDAKGGVLVFNHKVLSSHGTYEQFTLQQSFGMLVRMSQHYDLRLQMFGDFHFSNAFMVDVNPGLDVMNAGIGLVYHLGSRHLQVASTH